MFTSSLSPQTAHQCPAHTGHPGKWAQAAWGTAAETWDRVSSWRGDEVSRAVPRGAKGEERPPGGRAPHPRGRGTGPWSRRLRERTDHSAWAAEESRLWPQPRVCPQGLRKAFWLCGRGCGCG